MRLLVLFFYVVFLWLTTNPAYADPISAIAAISSFIGSIGVIGKLVLTVAINVGLSLIDKAKAKKSEASTPSGVKLQVTMGDDQPMSFILGNYATAGRRKYIGTWGDDGKTPNAYLTDVIELGNLPASGLNGMWADDRHCTILWGEPAADGRGYPVAEYRIGDKDYLWVRFVDGTQTVADPFVRGKFGFNTDRPFKETMIGYGCPYVVLTARFNTDLFSGMPNWLFEVASIKLYDLRKDSTNGGVGSHRWSNPATWEPSANPVVMAYNVIRGIYYGNEWIYGGQNLAAFCLPASSFIAGANACDMLTALSGGGSEPSSRACLEVHCDQAAVDTINELLKTCSGRMAEIGGIFKVLVGVPGAAVYSFSDDDVVVTQEQDYAPFPSLGDTYNAIEATYPEPAEKWATKDAPGRYYPDFEVLDGNRRLPVQVELPAAPFANQVQRIGQAMILDYRRFRTHQFFLPPDAYPLEPNDCTSYSSLRNGYSNKKFLVDKVVVQRNFLVLVTLKEIDPSDYDWDPSQQLPTSIGWIGPITPPPQPMYGWQVDPGVLTDRDGAPWRPTIKISCAPDQDDVRNVWVQVRLKATQVTVFDSQQTPYAEPYSWLLNANFQSNTDYEARGKFIPYSNRVTEWSEWLVVRTPNVATDDLIVDLQHVKKDITNRFKELQAELDDTRPLIEQLLVNTQTASVVFSSAQTLLSATVGENKATFDQQIAVVADDLSAAVAQTTELSVDLADRFATGLIKFTVAADQTGVNARFSIALRAGKNASYVESGMFLEIYTQSGVQKSRFSVSADQFSVLNPDNFGSAFLPLVFEGGVLKLNHVKVEWADIVNATIGWAQIQSAVVGNFVATNANIGNLVVGTSNLGFDSVTGSAFNTGAGSGVINVDWQPIGQWTINNENPSPVMTQCSAAFVVIANGHNVVTGIVRLVNVTDGVEVWRYTITVPAGGQNTSGSTSEMTMEPRSGSKGIKLYQWQASLSALNATASCTQLWWKR